MKNRVKTIIVTTDNGHGVLDTLECIYQTYFNVVKVEFIMECD